MGREVARHYAGRGRDVVITGRDADRAKMIAGEIGEGARGLGFDLTEPRGIAAALSGLGPVEYLVVAAIERDANSVREYDVASALRLVTLKLVGYTEVVHTLADRLTDTASIVLFGGLAKERPYPGSTTVSTVNGGVSGLVRTLATELAPVRVNAIHPGVVSDSPYWAGKTEAIERIAARTPTGRLPTMANIVHAVTFLLENPAVNGVDLYVDSGWVTL
jgi:NAD(P)-dependent dehydrogenase (short-subunit alcohol dehydrogenase family)